MNQPLILPIHTSFNKYIRICLIVAMALSLIPVAGLWHIMTTGKTGSPLSNFMGWVDLALYFLFYLFTLKGILRLTPVSITINRNSLHIEPISFFGINKSAAFIRNMSEFDHIEVRLNSSIRMRTYRITFCGKDDYTDVDTDPPKEMQKRDFWDRQNKNLIQNYALELGTATGLKVSENA